MGAFLQDWIEFEEIADLEERAKSQFFEKVHEEVVLKTQEAAKEKEFQSVPAGPAGVDEVSITFQPGLRSVYLERTVAQYRHYYCYSYFSSYSYLK